MENEFKKIKRMMDLKENFIDTDNRDYFLAPKVIENVPEDKFKTFIGETTYKGYDWNFDGKYSLSSFIPTGCFDIVKSEY